MIYHHVIPQFYYSLHAYRIIIWKDLISEVGRWQMDHQKKMYFEAEEVILGGIIYFQSVTDELKLFSVWVWRGMGGRGKPTHDVGTKWSDLQNWPFCRSPCVHTLPCHTTTCFSTCLRWLVHWASVLLGLLGFFKEPWQQRRGRGLGIT